MYATTQPSIHRLYRSDREENSISRKKNKAMCFSENSGTVENFVNQKLAYFIVGLVGLYFCHTL